jgi:UDP-N-acetylmuramoyl-L-alanyl-D-glutamate--2,6-diaminopimelate ligase
MKLSELLDGVEVRAIHGDSSVEVGAVTADSRLVTKGALFAAIPGFKRDGSEFVTSAIEKGAAAIVTEHAPPAGSGKAVIVEVLDARKALSKIAAAFHGRPAERLQIVGVTGTSGKTTTTKMIESVLDATGDPVGLIGTIEYRAGDERLVADRTTPDAVVLQDWFARMARAGVRRAVMEVSSHALALHRTHGVPFAAAVFTNLSRDHFDFHKDFEDYFAAKKMLFDQIDRTRQTAVVNIDDEYGRRLADELGSAALTFGRTRDAAIHPAPYFEVSVDGLHGVLETPIGDIRMDSDLLGLPNLYNWMGAIGSAIVLGIDTKTIEAGVKNLDAVRGRFERVPSEGGPTVVVDYAHKPDALEKLLHAVRAIAGDRRLVLVIGCGGDRDKGKRSEMGAIAGKLADFTILTSDNPRSESPEAILDDIEQGMKDVDRSRYVRIVDRHQAVQRAIRDGNADDVVVIAGKGHETYQVVGDQVVHFDDREEAELALKMRSA